MRRFRSSTVWLRHSIFLVSIQKCQNSLDYFTFLSVDLESVFTAPVIKFVNIVQLEHIVIGDSFLKQMIKLLTALIILTLILGLFSLLAASIAASLYSSRFSATLEKEGNSLISVLFVIA